jgi:hypothetical protein
MTRPSTPLLGLLAATVIVAVLMLVVFKPSSSTSAGGGSIGQYQGAINAARASAAAQNRAAAKGGGSVANAPAKATKPAVVPAKPAVVPAKPAAAHHVFVVPRHGSGPAQVNAALTAGRPIAILFYNPAAADDQAVRAELDHLRAFPHVLKLAVPVSSVSSYVPLINEVSINETPTLVIVNHAHQATTIVGFTTTFEISGRIADALAVNPK